MYKDPRTWSIDASSRFVKMADLFGLGVLADEIFKAPQTIDLVRNKRNQVYMSWTDDSHNGETIDQLKTLGLDAIIYDRYVQFALID